MINLDEGRDNDLMEIKQLVLENNKMLHSMRRTARISMFMRLFYWLIIIGFSVGAFIYIQPYIDQFRETYTGLQAAQQKVSNFPQSITMDSIKDYFGISTTTKK